ncbi:MAG: SDR family oxidoreductase [Verrucomicrobiae bacterium]|nr:SDR family oxidoreductase [Verrucomicrobiae bacterium]
MDLGLQGKIALVTGGSRGIGRAIARALADEGCRVAICDLNPPAEPGDLFFVQADVTKSDDVRRVVDAVVAKWNGLDILVNNVGGGGGRELRPVEEVPESQWQKTWDLNASAAVRFTRLAIPHMRRAKWGRVVSIASVTGKEGGGRPWYTMAKSAEIALMKSLALNRDLVRDGITFNTVAPGRVIFPDNEWDQFRQEDPARFEQTIKARLPLGRCGTPDEVAAAVVFLCSARASLVNGACLAVDGGESYSF